MAESKLAQKDEPEWGFTYKERLSFALEHGLFSNVIFLVGTNEEVIRGHRDILILGSTIFQALLTGKSFEDEKPIKIPNVQPSGFKLLLKFFYERKIPNIPNEDFMEFFKAVKYFRVEELYKVCREHILEIKLTLGNAIDVYENCKVLEESELEEAVESFIKGNAESILAQPKFTELSAKNLLYFISSDNFSASEVAICLAVYKWGEAECKRQKLEMNSKTLRLVLKDMIPQIRFPLMNSQDFAVEIAKLKLLTFEETVDVYNYFLTRQYQRHQIPEGVRFISKPRKRVKYEDQDGVDNIVWNLDGRINTGLRTDSDTIYTISNKGVGSANYLNVFYDKHGVVATKDLTKYEFGGEGYCSTLWGIRRGSEPKTYTLFSKYGNGYLTWQTNNYFLVFGPEDKRSIQSENLTLEPSKKAPGFFLMTTGLKKYKSGHYFVLSLSDNPIEGRVLRKVYQKTRG